MAGPHRRAARHRAARLGPDQDSVRQAPARLAPALERHYRPAEGGRGLQGDPPGDGADPQEEPEPEHPPVRAQPAVPRVRRGAPEAGGARRHLPRSTHRLAVRASGGPSRRLPRRPGVRAGGGAGRRADPGRNARPHRPAVPARSRPPHPRPIVDDAVGGRGAAAASRLAGGRRPRRRALRVRRAVGRPPPARAGPAARRHRQAARSREHDPRRRARRRDDETGGLADRRRPRRRRARRGAALQRSGRRPRAPRRSSQPDARVSLRRRAGPGSRHPPRRPRRAAAAAGRPSQPRPRGRGVPAGRAQRDHRRVGGGEVEPGRGTGRAARSGACGRRADYQDHRRRSVADRPDAAIESRDLHGFVRCRARPVRGAARVGVARVRQGAVLVQRRGRALRGLPGCRRAAHRHALPRAGRRRVRHVRREAVQRRDARGGLARPHHPRPARDDGRGGGRPPGRPAASRPHSRHALGTRPWLPAPRPAVHHPVRRRGAAHQAGGRTQSSGARAHALRARRTDDRPAPGRRGHPPDRARTSGGPAAHGGGRRAPPRRDSRRRPRDRPRSGRRPARRPDRRPRNPRGRGKV